MGSWGHGTMTIGIPVIHYFKKHREVSIFSREDTDELAGNIRKWIIHRLRTTNRVIGNKFGFGAGLDTALDVVYLPNFSARKGARLTDCNYGNEDYPYYDDLDSLMYSVYGDNCDSEWIEIPSEMYFNITFLDRTFQSKDILSVMQELMYYLYKVHDLFVADRIFNITDMTGVTFASGMEDFMRKDTKVFLTSGFSEEEKKEYEWYASKFDKELKKLADIFCKDSEENDYFER